MRTPSQPKAPDVERARPTAPAAPAQAVRPPTGLLALQVRAGNAAVVQMLRRSGHPQAQRQHRHQGHGTAEQAAPVQRSAVENVLRTPGRPMDPPTRADMELRLGADFGDVRIHEGAAARESAAEIGARAYTSGSHVVIGEGGADAHTLAHELTHVIQQRQGPVAGSDNGSGLRISDPSDRFEQEAEANARRVMSRAAPTTAGPGDDPLPRSGGAAAAGIQRMNAPGNPAVPPVPVAPAGPAVQQIDFANAVPLAGDGTTRWTPTAGFSNTTHLMTDVPSATVRVSGLGAPGERVALAAFDSTAPATELGRSAEVDLAADEHTFTVPLAGLPGQGAVGLDMLSVDWRVIRATGTQDAGPSLHFVYHLFDTPTTTGQARAQAVWEATAMAAGHADAQGVATALRQGIRSRINYNPADPINDDPLTVLSDGVGICTDFGNLHVLLAQTIGLHANAAMFWGGFSYGGQNVWVTDRLDNTTLTDVRATDTQYHPNQGMQGWDFTYHAIARINGVLHDAALNREGVDARAAHEGLQVAYRDIITLLPLPAGAVGQPYVGSIMRDVETVSLTIRDYGDRITANDFGGIRVLTVPPGTTGLYADPALLVALGHLPPGLALDPSGLITGTPTTPGNYQFGVAPFDNLGGLALFDIQVS
ncbi:eCIS core domain-containing protein [Kitasatospora acidiphila]|uniref:eCIS core domain-containing protein n=1 Tax=Kitasatospora acidiphila TaxID=2567942 RepID=UPI003C70E41F